MQSPLTPAGEQRILKLREELAQLEMAQYSGQAMPVNVAPKVQLSIADDVARLRMEADAANKRIYELEERIARLEHITRPEEIAGVLGQMVQERRANG